jgi:glucose 1-dehydrogenase
LQGKVAIITGAGSGIGAAIARRFAQEGAWVVVNYFQDHQAEAEALVRDLKRLGTRAIPVSADVSSATDVARLVQETISEFGTLDILVNNAAVFGERSPFKDIAEDDWDRVIATNLKGPFLCAQRCVDMMIGQNKGGSIINISSIHEDLPLPGSTAYCMAKGGLRMMMRNMALELGPHNIRVNNIAPGPIAVRGNAQKRNTPQVQEVVPLGRMGEPPEVAEVALFLASARSAYVTGGTYSVDGGLLRYATTV